MDFFLHSESEIGGKCTAFEGQATEVTENRKGSRCTAFEGQATEVTGQVVTARLLKAKRQESQIVQV